MKRQSNVSVYPLTPSRRPTSASVLVSDGAGGMRPIVDRRFDDGEWPVHLRVPARRAASWMAQLDAECELRGHATSSLSQLDPTENSGTSHVSLGKGANPTAVEIVWERARDKLLLISARPSGEPSPALAEIRAFLAAVTRACRANRKKRMHRRAYLTYEGLPWRGELWLSPNLCLGPPTMRGDYLNDPQIIIVDAVVEAVASRGINAEFGRVLRELIIFLDVIIGIRMSQQQDKRVWVNTVDDKGRYTRCELRQSAYYELDPEPKMPVPGSHRAVPNKHVQRPGLGALGIRPDDAELTVPDDIHGLWHQLQSLPEPRRRQFLQAGNAYSIAQLMWPDQRTTITSFLVVACEALKPSGRKYRGANVYDVIASLQGAAVAETLRTLALYPQGVRSQLFHHGTVVSDELYEYPAGRNVNTQLSDVSDRPEVAGHELTASGQCDGHFG